MNKQQHQPVIVHGGHWISKHFEIVEVVTSLQHLEAFNGGEQVILNDEVS